MTRRAARARPRRAPRGHAPRDPTAAATIRAWVDAERNGEAIRAAAYFSLPAIVLNGPEPLLLRTPSNWFVNSALPCGATLLRRSTCAADHRPLPPHRRPGRHCDGVGNTASTAFAMRKGKIAMWIRVAGRVGREVRTPRPPDRDLRNGRIEGRRVPTNEEPAPAA